MENLNQTIFQYLNGFAFQHGWLDELIIFFATDFGILLVLVAGIFLVTHRHLKEGIKNILVIALAAGLAWVISKAIKYFYISPRPFLALENVNLLFEHGDHDSFPSGHATFFSALAFALFAYHKRIGIAYALGALIIGASRVTAGVHWPIDILAGYIMGGIIGYSAYIFISKYMS